MTDKQQWAPEPWHVADYQLRMPEIFNENGVLIAHVSVHPSAVNLQTAEANAARIVECVNACALVPGPIPPGIVAEMVEVLQHALDACVLPYGQLTLKYPKGNVYKHLETILAKLQPEVAP